MKEEIKDEESKDKEEDGEYKDGLWTNLVFAGQRVPLSSLAQVGQVSKENMATP